MNQLKVREWLENDAAALRVVEFVMGTDGYDGMTTATIAQRLSLPVKKVAAVMHKLQRLNVVQSMGANLH